jgi:lysophospholipase L1-like esterase
MQWLLQTLLLGLTFLLACWVQLPRMAMAGLGVAAAALIFQSLARPIVLEWADGAALPLLWLGSLTVWLSMARADIDWSIYYAIPASLMAMAVWVPARRASGGIWKGRWNAAVMAWLLAGVSAWVAAGYFQNQRDVFYCGLLALLSALVLCRYGFRWGAVGAQTLNALILLLVAMPIVDLALRPQSRVPVRTDTCRLYYSYDAAKGDPESFGRWEEYYASQFDRLGLEIFMPDPQRKHGFVLRPRSQAVFVNCPISINSLGFRGPEISASKNGAYRIVVLGESTTFGMTIDLDDKPWPERLEQIIRERLKTRRPVQVINAGVPAYSLSDNLARLRGQILPLQPDMIISYHGANGFHSLDSTVLPPVGPSPPVYRERPIKLAADAEHRLRMLIFQYKTARHRVSSAPPASTPLETPYAAAYGQLIQCARTHGIRLALANFSMAVNQASDPRVIDFYRGGGNRAAIGFMRANALHSLILSQLAGQNPEVCLVDTHPHLDGDHEKFIDLIHFAAGGERQMAENMFAGIRPTLERELAPTQPPLK